jgi:hypothetical protein
VIPQPKFEQRWRRALFDAMLPEPGDGLPAMADVQLESFWPRFDAVAPIHLRFALRAATYTLGGALPFALGYRRTVAGLSPTQRDVLLQRAAGLPLVCELVEVVKIVCCFAYFDVDQVQRRVRAEAGR